MAARVKTGVELAKRVPHDELVELARGVVLPEECTDVVIVVDHEPGEKLPEGSWSGKGGRTRFGPAFVVRGRETQAPFALFESQRDAFELHALVAGEEGELWQRKQRRRQRVIEMEAAEREAESEAKLARGGGSPRPSRSSARPTGTTGKSSGGPSPTRSRPSETTSSPLPSSSSARSRGSSAGSTGPGTGPSFAAPG